MTACRPDELPEPREDDWLCPAKRPRLESGEVHVWWVDLAAESATTAELRAILSKDELERCDRFRTPLLRRRFLVGRARLRQLIAEYSGLRPQEMVFDYGDHGKPRLRQGGLEFNLAHCGDQAVYAFGREQAIGVDIEQEAWKESLERVADRYFSADEVQAITSATGSARAAMFFTLWTRKEALLKASGVGISVELRRIDVLPGRAPRADSLVQQSDLVGETWHLHETPPVPGHRVALATSMREVSLRAFR